MVRNDFPALPFSFPFVFPSAPAPFCPYPTQVQVQVQVQWSKIAPHHTDWSAVMAVSPRRCRSLGFLSPVVVLN